MSTPHHPEEEDLDREVPSTLQPELEARLLNHYFQLTVDDLQQISPRVHEWLLDRVSNAFATSSAGTSATLMRLYFLFPESTVRHAVVGLLVQADGESETSDRASPRPPIAIISEAIDEDEGLSPEGRADQIRLLVDFLLDYLDLFPEATERALTALHQGHRDEKITAHLLAWSIRLGGELESRIRRAFEHPDRRG